MSFPEYGLPSQGSSSSTDIVTQLQAIVRQLGAWVLAFRGRITFGTFTFAAATTTVVAQPAVQATSVISLTALNPAAGTLVGSAKSPYISAIVPGVSFTVTTANAVAATGTEMFSYLINTPS